MVPSTGETASLYHRRKIHKALRCKYFFKILIQKFTNTFDMNSLTVRYSHNISYHLVAGAQILNDLMEDWCPRNPRALEHIPTQPRIINTWLSIRRIPPKHSRRLLTPSGILTSLHRLLNNFLHPHIAPPMQLINLSNRLSSSNTSSNQHHHRRPSNTRNILPTLFLLDIGGFHIKTQQAS